MSKKIRIEKRTIFEFYVEILRVIIPYVISTIFIVLFRIYVIRDMNGIKNVILNVMGYGEYAWYVNMYIGLYLMIPFLNVLWRAIGDKFGHKFFLGILFCITIAPSIFNVFDLCTKGALLRPWVGNTYSQLVPNWWSQMYPLMYYFTGAYIKKYINIMKFDTK